MTAVAVIQFFEDATLEQYDQVLQQVQERMQQTPPAPEGSLTHWAALTDTGLRVDEVWESIDHFEKFSREVLQSLTRAANIKDPQIATYTVHNYMVTPTAAQQSEAQSVGAGVQGQQSQ